MQSKNKGERRRLWGRGCFSKRSASPPDPLSRRVSYIQKCEGGGFSERSSATSIGAANGRLFRLRKTAMLSRHWRLWLSFPSLALPPEEQLAFDVYVSAKMAPPESWARFPVAWLWSRRLAEPPRPANAGSPYSLKRDRAKVSKGRSQSRQTGSVLWSCPQARNPASADAPLPKGSLRRGSSHALRA